MQITTETLKDLLIAAGASVWEKGTMKRIYINQDVADKVFNQNILAEYSQNHIEIGNAKFYLDLKSMALISDKGSVRTAINSTKFEHGLGCSKP